MENRTERSMTAHNMIRAMILGGIAFYIAYLHVTGKLNLYIAPRMSIYVKLAAMALYVIAVLQVYQAYRVWTRRNDSSCGCEHPPEKSFVRSALVYSLFIIPLGAAILSPDTTIGSAMAANKGITLSTAQTIKTKAPEAAALTDQTEAETNAQANVEASTRKADSAATGDELDRLFPADEYTESYAAFGKKLYKQDLITVKEKSYMETLTTVDLFLDNYIGKKLTIEGFVYRDDTLKPDQFILGRFAVQCCTADAMPYGVMIESSRAGQYDTDTWLRMTGTLSKTDYNGNEVILLKATKIEKIKPAADPYVYPNYEF